MEFMVLLFTKETKSEATWHITSVLIYYRKYTSVAGNAYVGAQEGKKYVAQKFESIAEKLSGARA